MPKSKKAPQLPDTVYVYSDGGNRGGLLMDTDINNLPEGVEIGIYQLSDLRTLSVTRELVKG